MGLFNFLFKKEQVEEKVVEKKEETKLLEKKDWKCYLLDSFS